MEGILMGRKVNELRAESVYLGRGHWFIEHWARSQISCFILELAQGPGVKVHTRGNSRGKSGSGPEIIPLALGGAGLECSLPMLLGTVSPDLLG